MASSAATRRHPPPVPITHPVPSTLAAVTALIGELAEQHPLLSVTVTGQIRRAYVHTVDLDGFEAWCERLKATSVSVAGPPKGYGPTVEAVAHLGGGWALHVWFYGEPEGGQA